MVKANGNDVLRRNGRTITAFRAPFGPAGYKYSVKLQSDEHPTYSSNVFLTKDEAKLGAFDIVDLAEMLSQ